MVKMAAAQQAEECGEDDAGVDGGGHDAEFERRGEQKRCGVGGEVFGLDGLD